MSVLPPLRPQMLFLASWALALLLAAMAAGAGPAETPAVGLEALARLDQLARYRPSVKVASISSYDRAGGNDDGFSGKYSFVRKEGEALVLADLKGPGMITRIWTPTPTDDRIEFFFDDEAAPRLALPFRALFDGEHAPFLAPLAGHGAGGFWSYLPLPYRKACRVVLRAPKMQFYQINFATYPEDFPLASFEPALPGEARARFERARQLLNAAGTDVSAAVAPEGVAVQVATAARSVAPGGRATLFETQRGGRLLGLRLSPASALAGRDRAAVLRITWDGDPEPAVAVPVADFFGHAWGEPAARSLLLGTVADTDYLYLPMPFDREARVELALERVPSGRSGPPVEVRAEVLHAETPRREDEGRFYAVWRRENPTAAGRSFTFVEAAGRGHLVGVALQAQGMAAGETPFFEGDDEAILDGELALHGTGSEDFFNGGWYDVPGRWDRRLSFPLSGCLDYKKAMGRTGAYRLFLTDAYAFQQSLRLTIEHGPEGNRVPSDHVGVTYLYADRRPAGAGTLPPPGERAVRDPERLLYAAGWSLPLYAFSFERATLSKKNEKIGGAEVRFLALHAEGQDVFGPHTLAPLLEVPAAGRYRVSIEALEGPDQGRVQLFENERPAGDPVDLYAPERRKSRLLPLGTVTLREGDNPVFFKLIGKNEKATALRFELIRVELVREA